MTNIELQGELSIENAEETQKLFISAVEKQQPVTVDISKLEDMDVSILQLLFALYNELKPDLPLKISGEVSDLVKKRLYTLGVIPSLDLSSADILTTIETKMRESYE